MCDQEKQPLKLTGCGQKFCYSGTSETSKMELQCNKGNGRSLYGQHEHRPYNKTRAQYGSDMGRQAFHGSLTKRKLICSLLRSKAFCKP